MTTREIHKRFLNPARLAMSRVPDIELHCEIGEMLLNGSVRDAHPVTDLPRRWKRSIDLPTHPRTDEGDHDIVTPAVRIEAPSDGKTSNAPANG